MRRRQAYSVCNAGRLSVPGCHKGLVLGKRLACPIEPDLSVASVQEYHTCGFDVCVVSLMEVRSPARWSSPKPPIGVV
jgi:hypothetical protein